jgi:hypothetical protein
MEEEYSYTYTDEEEPLPPPPTPKKAPPKRKQKEDKDIERDRTKPPLEPIPDPVQVPQSSSEIPLKKPRKPRNDKGKSREMTPARAEQIAKMRQKRRENYEKSKYIREEKARLLEQQKIQKQKKSFDEIAEVVQLKEEVKALRKRPKPAPTPTVPPPPPDPYAGKSPSEIFQIATQDPSITAFQKQLLAVQLFNNGLL